MRWLLLWLSTFFCLVSGTLYAQEAATSYPLSRQDNALVEKYTQRSSEWKARGDEKEASRYQNEIAMIYWNHNQYRKAITHYEKSLDLNQDLDNENGIAMIHNNLGMLYSDIGEYDTAYDYFMRTLAARRSNKEKIGMISALINLSVVLNNLDRYDESIKNLEEALELARELNDPDQMKSCYGMLSETHEKAGNPEKSIYYFELYRTFHEKVQREKIKRTEAEAEAARLRAQLAEAEKRNQELQLREKDKEIAEYDATQKNLLDSLSRRQLEVEYFKQQKRIRELEAIEAREKQQLLDAQLEKTQLVRNGFIGGFALIVLFSFFLYRNYRQKKRINNDLKERNEEVNMQNEEIRVQRDQILEQSNQLEVIYRQMQEKNLQITRSINYAQRIQDAMLTREPPLTSLLPASFVLFKPRDVVSGDFYWYGQKNGRIILAAVDCTGHGVPGAFMSMIGNDLLDTIVKTNGITRPDLILSAMHQGVMEALNQKQTDNKDGMDIALIVLDPEAQKLHFAGANRPLLLVRGGQLEEYKGTRRGIGGYLDASRQQKDFESHTVSLDQPAHFYIFSDGYQDQFGGEHDRKFMIKRLKKLLLEIHEQPPAEQQRILDHTIEEWMKDTEQIDDILVIGGQINANSSQAGE